MTIKIGSTVTWTDEAQGQQTGKLVEVWPEQQTAVVSTDDGHLEGMWFVPYAKIQPVVS